MDKEKQAFEEWFSMESTKEELNFSNYLYGENCYPIRFTRGFYGGYHARDAEIASLKDVIERKDEALRQAFGVLQRSRTWGGTEWVYHGAPKYRVAKVLRILDRAITKTEEVEG